MPLDDELSELDDILKGLRFSVSDEAGQKDLERARLLVANMRVFVLHIVEQLGAAE